MPCCRRPDVFIQNLAPGAAERLGLDAASLLRKHPRIIACDVSGYGTGGPYSDKKAYDLAGAVRGRRARHQRHRGGAGQRSGCRWSISPPACTSSTAC